jgi:integrase
MPLRIVAARNKKTTNLYIRGSYLGVTVDKSCRTDRRSLAVAILKRLVAAIERGEYPARKLPAKEEPTFLSAAVAYMEAGRRRRYVPALIKHFGEMMPLREINQEAIDRAAIAICPNAGPGSRNAAVYTPIAAILHHAGIDMKMKRPKGAKGRVVTDWLQPNDAFGIIAAAERFNKEFALLLKFLLYTGLRLSEPLSLSREDLRLDDCAAWARRKKGQAHSEITLQGDLCAELRHHLGSHDHHRVFRFHQGGHLKHLLLRAKLSYLGLPCSARRETGWRPPPYRLAWVNFHSFRHTWASWMRKYAGVDIQGLVATGNWSDPRSAARYAHAVPRDEWSRVDQLPSMGKTRGQAS